MLTLCTKYMSHYRRSCLKIVTLSLKASVLKPIVISYTLINIIKKIHPIRMSLYYVPDANEWYLGQIVEDLSVERSSDILNPITSHA